MTEVCKSCGAEILWSRSTKGKWMPLDAAEVTEGVRFVVAEDGTAYSTVIGPGHMSHFATCPNANQHRKVKQEGFDFDA